MENLTVPTLPTLIIPQLNSTKNYTMACFSPNMMITPGIFRYGNEKPYLYTFTLFLMQLIIGISTTRFINFILQPLRLPRHISEVISGIILGPSGVGRAQAFVGAMFPLRSFLPLHSIAHLGLIYYVFTMGLEIDLPSIRRSGWRCFWFACACTISPFALALVSGSTLHKMLGEQTNRAAFVIFISVIFSMTAFSVLARTVTELKLVNTDIGRLTLSAAIVVDGFAWIGLSLAVAISESGGDTISAIFSILSGIIFYAVCFSFIKPMMEKLSNKVISGKEPLGEFEETAILVGVLLSAFIGDSIGIHAVFGAFTYGLAIPQGPISASLVEKVDDFVGGIMLPFFFTGNGLVMDLGLINNLGLALYMAALVLMAALLKVLGGVLIAAAYDMQMHDGVSYGLLMNSKGVIELAMLNIGLNRKILGQKAYTILVLMSVVLTAVITPLLNSVVKPTRGLVFYKRRTVRWHDPGSELRIISCVHNLRDVPALISLIDCTSPTKRTPVSVSAVQLIELTGHTPTMLLLNNATSRGSKYGNHFHAQSVAVKHAFESYAQHTGGLLVRTSTAISPFLTMHEDIITEAENCHAALVLLPFHMHIAVDGALEVTSHPAVRSVNKKVLELSPCTVAVVVDRGIGAISNRATALHVAVLFFGGPDDRESLAIAGRMSNHPSIEICVVRFLSRKGNASINSFNSDDAEARERYIDEQCLGELAQSSTVAVFDYREHVVSNTEETVELIRRIEFEGMDLVIVGKEQGLMGSTLTAGMTEWSEFPELGPLGDLLASADFGATSSVIIVQAPLSGGGVVDSTIIEMVSDRREDPARISYDLR
ncbi:Cation/H(+) antiporter 15 [Rhynchospora pubera]|uniref:Cation/H(+) antiporter 15 n=1 Tax=Rhynchospora pubera TaxID=906938 RepID=A0AAV8GU23_9POAL|nr:Cation/H(+) antiporter 15 [Rhynchospora pubera]KAJ4780078.1 Cation/H(+) antiporter 15 [Rhynchospora pubera]KAJ4807381.1 Cation/H(+) antiporter 15 [Rhynchospora pubera]